MANADTGSVGRSVSGAGKRSDAVATEVRALRPRSRKASESHASHSPVPGEHMDVPTARPTKNSGRVKEGDCLQRIGKRCHCVVEAAS